MEDGMSLDHWGQLVQFTSAAKHRWPSFKDLFAMNDFFFEGMANVWLHFKDQQGQIRAYIKY